MFRIDKSLVKYIDANISILVVDQPVPEPVQELAPQPEEASNKAQEAPRVPAEVEAQIQQMTETASAEAVCIIETAKKQARDVLEAARLEGAALGRQEGQAEARAAHAAAVQAQREEVRALEDGLREYKAQIKRELEESVLRLSLAVAQKIVNETIRGNDIVFREMIQSAIKRANPKEAFVLRVSSSMYDKHFAQGWKWLEEDLGCAPLTVVKDEKMDETAGVLECDGGTVDFGVGAQTGRIAQCLGSGEQDDFEH